MVQPAIGFARTGVVVPPGLADTLANVYPALMPGPGAAIYQPAGVLLRAGDLLRHADLDRRWNSWPTQGTARSTQARSGPRSLPRCRPRAAC